MSKQFVRFVFFFLLFMPAMIEPITRDNRFFPFIGREFFRTCTQRSRLTPFVFFNTASDAFAPNDTEEGISEVWGKYDQANVARALDEIGKPTGLFLRFPQLIGTKIIWNIEGKLQSQGIGVYYDQHLYDWLSIGWAAAFMHVFSNQDFLLSQEVFQRLNMSPSEFRELDDIRRNMNNLLGLEGPKWSKTGATDMRLYVDFGNVWDYTLKFRRIDAGLRVGALIPTGVTRDPNNPASVPFSGNGLWGIYARGDAEFELKEDWKTGLMLQFNQRFSKTRDIRVPIQNEQPLFGAVVVPVKIEPGFTFIFSPYFRLESIREGFGFSAKYSLTIHEDDTFKDARTGVREPQLTLGALNKLSEWRSEYVTFSAFMDFGRVWRSKACMPTVWLSWSAPFRILAAEGVAKTQYVQLGLEWIY